MFKTYFSFVLLFSILLISNSNINAQVFGNEWINHSQKYVKIKISQEGLYGINVNQVIQSGLISQNIDPEKFQLFNKGQQIPLLVTGDSDNNFDGDDKIVFYGKPNDGSLDKVLYNNQQDIPNEEVSLYEDDNYYFLTYNENGSGLRFLSFSLNSSGLVAESHIIYKSRLNYTSSYYPGEYILEGMSLSEYIEGEGYLGTLFGKGESFSTTLNTPDFINTPEFQSTFSFYVAGRSNALSTSSGGNNHHLRVTAYGTLMLDTIYKGYKTIRKKTPITINNGVASITFSSVDDLGALTDFQAPGYAEIIYSRQLKLNSITELKFSLANAKVNSYLSFSNSNITSPILLDISRNYFFNGIKSGSNLDFVVNNNQEQRTYYLGDLNNLKPVTLESVTFRAFTVTDVKSFLLISSKALTDGANSYNNYNNTIRNIETTIAYTEDLYNEFYFGFHHPLAIRNFCTWALKEGVNKPEYLLLLGKGYETARHNLGINLVPTYGYPASDNLLTAGIVSTTTEPAIPTGRIPATTNEEIENYLNKLKVYEQLPDSLWRKKLVHVTGGRSSSENSSFKNYLNNLYNIAKEEKFGATVINFNKNVTDAVTESLTEGIVRETREGAALISFLGHGSTTTTEVSLGGANTINNSNKPTVYIVNGCSTANSFTSAFSYGEQFVLQKDYGAVGWIGTTSEGVASYLYSFTNNFYKNWFNTSYGKSIAYGIQQSIKASTNPSEKLSMAHSRQYILLGDPYLKYMATEKPDYAMEQNSIYLSPAIQNASQENLKFDFIVGNPGKVIKDSLEVKITRILADNTSTTPYIFKIKPIYNTVATSTQLSNLGYNVKGTNKLIIDLDPNNKFDEKSKVNNRYEFSFFLTGNGVNPIFPLKNSITNNITLKAQPDNLFTTNTNYVFEIDTVLSFNSNFKLSSDNILANILPEWLPNIQPENNKVYFWRVKINDPNIAENWNVSSFTYSSDIHEGYSIGHLEQIEKSKTTLSGIEYDEDSKTFNFGTDIFSTTISTRGDDIPVSNWERRMRINPNSAISYIPVESTGITMAAFHPIQKGKLVSYPSLHNSTYGPNIINGYTGQYFWDTNNQAAIDSMVSFINQLPNGYYVMGLNNYNCSPKDLPEDAKQALRSIGLTRFEEVGMGEPYAFWGTKGSPEGSAIEYTADYTSSTNARSQYFREYHDLIYRQDNGVIISDKFGPALSWDKAEIKYDKRESDELKYSIIGVNKSGTESVLLNNSTDEEIDLKLIVDATIYPYIKIKTEFKNSELRNIPKLNYWRAIYTPLTELTFNPPVKNDFHSESLLVGDSLRLELALSNISKQQNSDSVQVSYNITKPDNTTLTKSFKLAPLSANESAEFKIKENTIGLAGKNILTINLEDTGLGDNYNFNNSISYNFEVTGDNQEPKIDVLFDGKRIINGEIISPSPLIDIASIDENTILLQSDTSLINIYLKKEEENEYKRIYFSDGKLNIIQSGSSSDNRLVIRYTPNKLNDGKYILKVAAKDFLGNKNPSDFLTEFEVINESTITHFYPYPNPVVNSMRFVFTLTGNKIPDKIKIQILTSTGKVVREVLKEELGNLKIGNNISDFVWDCKDQFGDRLANGVYFYRVSVEDNAEDFKHRYTKGDSNFKNKIGKIYLLK